MDGVNAINSVTLAQIKDFAIIVAVLLALIVLIGNAVKTFKDWKKPADDLAQWRRDVDAKLDSDNKRLKALEEGNKMVCKGVIALMNHEITGNSVEKLKQTQEEMTKYLVER